jgi:hypothetical protein
MSKSDDSGFDFEYWASLAREDPQAFEARRRAVIDELITTAPPSTQRRLRGLQWQLDQARLRAGTPLAACLRISRMMWEAVLGEGGLLHSLQRLGARGTGERKETATPRRSATILSFPPPKRDP